MMAPCDGFYIHKSLGKKQVRIAYVLEKEKLSQAMDCLEAGLIAYNKAHMMMGSGQSKA
jgi:aspartate aminotransferase